jgi:hypothetical protein
LLSGVDEGSSTTEKGVSPDGRRQGANWTGWKRIGSLADGNAAGGVIPSGERQK